MGLKIEDCAKHAVSVAAKFLGYPTNLDAIYYPGQRRSLGKGFVSYDGADHLEMPPFGRIIFSLRNDPSRAEQDIWTKWNPVRMLFPAVYSALDARAQLPYIAMAWIADLLANTATIIAIPSGAFPALGARAAYQTLAAGVSTHNNSSMLRSNAQDSQQEM